MFRVVNSPRGSQTVNLSQSESAQLQAEWELRQNTRANQDTERETIAAAEKEVLQRLILTESAKAGASQIVKDAAGIIRGR